MKIIAEKLEKKFRKERIFTDFSYQFEQGTSYALTGPNGSGKSSLLKILSFYSLASKGSIKLLDDSSNLIKDDIAHTFIAFAAPYIQLIDEFSLPELLDFCINASFIPPISIEEFENFIKLKPGTNKFIGNYSSGMRQKIKLGISLLSSRPIILLDEPCTNLDRTSKDWFFNQIAQNSNKLIIIASNEKEEIDFCQKSISILDYKK